MCSDILGLAQRIVHLCEDKAMTAIKCLFQNLMKLLKVGISHAEFVALVIFINKSCLFFLRQLRK